MSCLPHDGLKKTHVPSVLTSENVRLSFLRASVALKRIRSEGGSLSESELDDIVWCIDLLNTAIVLKHQGTLPYDDLRFYMVALGMPIKGDIHAVSQTVRQKMTIILNALEKPERAIARHKGAVVFLAQISSMLY